MFSPADDGYRAQHRVSCRNALHPVVTVPYAYPAVRLEEATEVASQEHVYHETMFWARGSRMRAAHLECAIPPRGALALHPTPRLRGDERCGLSRLKGL